MVRGEILSPFSHFPGRENRQNPHHSNTPSHYHDHMQTVYRVEHHISGLGPYQHYPAPNHFDYDDTMMEVYEDEYYELKEEMETAHSDGEHPVLHCEGHLSAFESLEDLHIWFDGFVDWMMNLGFIVVEIDVENIFANDSTGQCIFRPELIISKRGVEA